MNNEWNYYTLICGHCQKSVSSFDWHTQLKKCRWCIFPKTKIPRN